MWGRTRTIVSDKYSLIRIMIFQSVWSARSYSCMKPIRHEITQYVKQYTNTGKCATQAHFFKYDFFENPTSVTLCMFIVDCTILFFSHDQKLYQETCHIFFVRNMPYVCTRKFNIIMHVSDVFLRDGKFSSQNKKWKLQTVDTPLWH